MYVVFWWRGRGPLVPVVLAVAALTGGLLAANGVVIWLLPWAPLAVLALGGAICIHIDRRYRGRHVPLGSDRLLMRIEDWIENYPNSFMSVPLIAWGWLFVALAIGWAMFACLRRLGLL